MSIDTTGKWWVGTDPEDIKEFLEAYASKGYEVHEFRLAKCSCGGIRFYLDADDDEGFATRLCTACGRLHFICDSEEYRDEAKPERCRCECGSEELNVGVAFSLYEDDKEIRWLYVGVRCTGCGILGCFAGWKIAYAPSRQLFDLV